MMLLLIALASAQLALANQPTLSATTLLRRQAFATQPANNLINLIANTASIAQPIVPATNIVNPLVLPAAATPVNPFVLPDIVNPLILPDVCSASAGRGPQVTSCALTEAEWAAFDIDGFLADFISKNGPVANFPLAFAQAHREPGMTVAFSCSSLESDDCDHPSLPVSSFSTNCEFAALSALRPGSHVCDRYTSPKAAFVMEDFLQLRRGLQIQSLAIGDARQALKASTFVNDITDGMAEEKGSIFDIVANLIITFPLQLLKSPTKIGKKLLNKFDDLNEVFNIVKGPEDVIAQVQANNGINDERERIQEQLDRQLDAIVVGERKRLQGLLDAMFRGSGTSGAVGLVQAGASKQFRSAMSGAFLAPVPNRQKLAEGMSIGLENFVVSSILQGMGYSLILDPTELFDAEANGGVSGAACRGNKGIPFVLGVPCALFRRGESFDSPKMQDSGVLERLVDVKSMLSNAVECDQGVPSTEDGAGDLPRCTYSFKVIRLPK